MAARGQNRRFEGCCTNGCFLIRSGHCDWPRRTTDIGRRQPLLSNPLECPSWVNFGLSRPTAATSAFRGKADEIGVKADIPVRQAASPIKGKSFATKGPKFLARIWKNFSVGSLLVIRLAVFRVRSSQHIRLFMPMSIGSGGCSGFSAYTSAVRRRFRPVNDSGSHYEPWWCGGSYAPAGQAASAKPSKPPSISTDCRRS